MNVLPQLTNLSEPMKDYLIGAAGEGRLYAYSINIASTPRWC